MRSQQQHQKEWAKEIRKHDKPRSETQKERTKELRKPGIIKTKKMEKELRETYEEEDSLQKLNEILEDRQKPPRRGSSSTRTTTTFTTRSKRRGNNTTQTGLKDNEAKSAPPVCKTT